MLMNSISPAVSISLLMSGDGVDADDLRPVVALFQSAAEGRGVFEIRDFAFGFAPRILEQEARGV
jgi:hypothetical protein